MTHDTGRGDDLDAAIDKMCLGGTSTATPSQ